MNVPLLTMPAHDARQAFEEYRAAVRARHTEEDEAIMRGYREMAQGRPLVDVAAAIQGAGLDELGRPRLAICRADGHYCWFRHRGGWGLPVFSMEQWAKRRAPRRFVELPAGTFGARDFEGRWANRYEARAVVPSIPPRFRPKAALENYHILWEAEWEMVPRDPLLLRHLYGYLYAVLAHWDLTELERSILAGLRP